jgi:CheY-like chemotaxis protein
MADAVKVLLVEDEPIVLLMMEQALADAGYSVVVAADGNEAISLFNARHDDIAGLITDVHLGEGADGWSVARHARHTKPELPVVYVTAESAGDWAAEGVPKSILLQKPFAAAQAITAISTLLNQVSSTPHSAS